MAWFDGYNSLGEHFLARYAWWKRRKRQHKSLIHSNITSIPRYLIASEYGGGNDVYQKKKKRGELDTSMASSVLYKLTQFF